MCLAIHQTAKSAKCRNIKSQAGSSDDRPSFQTSPDCHAYGAMAPRGVAILTLWVSLGSKLEKLTRDFPRLLPDAFAIQAAPVIGDLEEEL
jgi:hypothetical protein